MASMCSMTRHCQGSRSRPAYAARSIASEARLTTALSSWGIRSAELGIACRRGYWSPVITICSSKDGCKIDHPRCLFGLDILRRRELLDVFDDLLQPEHERCCVARPELTHLAGFA